MIGSDADQRYELAVKQVVAHFAEQRPVLGEGIVVSVDVDERKHQRVDLRPLAILVGAADDPVQRTIRRGVYPHLLGEHLWQELAGERT